MKKRLNERLEDAIKEVDNVLLGTIVEIINCGPRMNKKEYRIFKKLIKKYHKLND